MLEALAFLAYGLVFGALTLGWCFIPWHTSLSFKRAVIGVLSLLLGLGLAAAHMLVNLQFSFMVQFGLPAISAMGLFFWAVQHEPGRPAGQRNNARMALVIVALGVLGVILEFMELASFWSMLLSGGSIFIVVELLQFGGLSSIIDEALEPNAEGKTKAPRGLPDSPFLTRGVAWLLGCGSGITTWRVGPVLSWGFADLALFFFDVAFIAAMVTIIANFARNRFTKPEFRRGLIPTRVNLGLLAVSFVVAIVVPSVLSSPLFFWKQQAAVVGNTIKYASQAELVNVVRRSNEGKPRLPQAMADNIAHQRLGGAVGADGMGSLGKTSKVDHYTMQTLSAHFTARGSDGKEYEIAYTHEPVWLVPLEPSGPVIQLMRGHTDGFVIISANSLSQDNGHLVTHVNGKPLEIKYHCNGGYFSANVKRYLYRHGFVHMGLSEGRFILNPEGRPYCAVTGYRHATGFRTPITVQMLLVDVQTGEIQTFDPGQQPAWVDQVYTPWMWETHLNNWGSYRQPGKLGNGWVHQILDGTGVMQSSGEIARMEVDGKTVYFTTMTDGKSVTGYAIGDAQTLQTTLYQMPNGGITEQRAQGQVISDDAAISNLFKGNGGDKDHKPTGLPTISQPIPAVVNDRLVFQMVVTNANGAPSRYAFVGIDVVGVTAGGRTYPEALSDLHVKLEETVANNGDPVSNTGTLQSWVVVNGSKETEFWVYTNEFNGTAFAIPARSAPWLPSLQPGSKLTVTTVGNPRPNRRFIAVDIQRVP